MDFNNFIPSPEKIIKERIKRSRKWAILILYLIEMSEHNIPITLKQAEMDLRVPRALLFQQLDYLQSLTLVKKIKKGTNKYVLTQYFLELKPILKQECILRLENGRTD